MVSNCSGRIEDLEYQGESVIVSESEMVPLCLTKASSRYDRVCH